MIDTRKSDFWTPASAGVTTVYEGMTIPARAGCNRSLHGLLLLHVLFTVLIAMPVLAQGATGILDDRDVDAADPAALQAEAQLFETIRQGIALSIAECELTPKCKPTVNREELRRIVGKIETRLDALTTRHSKSGDAALEPVMLAYVGARDGYTEFLTKLDAILPPEADESGTRALQDAGSLPPEFAVFADADADLADDTDEPRAEDASPPADAQ